MQERPAASRLPLLGLLVGLWAVVLPYVVLFGELHVDATVEFVDHALPGLVVIVVAVVALRLLRAVVLVAPRNHDEAVARADQRLTVLAVATIDEAITALQVIGGELARSGSRRPSRRRSPEPRRAAPATT